MVKRLCVAACFTLALVACGKTDQQKQSEEAAKTVQQAAKTIEQGANQVSQGARQGSEKMAQGLQQMAQGLQQMAQESTVKVVDYEELKSLLPEINTWTRSEARGEQYAAGPVSTSRAQAVYRKDDSRIELEITDSAMSQMIIAPVSIFLGSGFSERSDDGFKRAVKVGGQPAMEEWNRGSKRGEVTALVGGRFIVHARGDDVPSVDPVRAVVEDVNLSKLATLK
jgi:hypothetical protein